jgi:hypothetical protein
MDVQLDTPTVTRVCAAAASRYILVHMCGDTLSGHLSYCQPDSGGQNIDSKHT